MTPLNLFDRWRNYCKTEAAKAANELEPRVHPVNQAGGPRQQARVSTGKSAKVGLSGMAIADITLLSGFHARRKWQPTPVFLPGESQELGSLVGCRLWGCTGSDKTEAT